MRLAVAIGVLACAARPADACVPAFERAIVGAPLFEPADAVTITSETVDVDCDEHFACTVRSTFGIAVAAPARASVKGFHTTQLSLGVNTKPPVPTLPSDPSERATATTELIVEMTRLELRARVDVVPFVDGCFTDGVIARHPYLASARESTEHVLQIDTAVTPTIKAPSSWDVVVDTRQANKHSDASTHLWFTVPGRRFTHGGALVMIGASSGEGSTFRVRGGWEVALGKPWLVFGITGETDFGDAWNAALVVEPTTQAWVLPLSLGAGAGVVVANGGRVGGRGQLSVAIGPARVMLSVDVIEHSDGDGIGATVAGLIGGSL